MQPDDEVYVGHMLDVVGKVVAKTERITREEFDRDENLRLALAHLLQTIGEAARRVSRELQAQHPEIPWARIAGFRNRIVHAYLDVDPDLIWSIIEEEVPPLVHMADSELKPT